MDIYITTYNCEEDGAVISYAYLTLEEQKRDFIRWVAEITDACANADNVEDIAACRENAANFVEFGHVKHGASFTDYCGDATHTFTFFKRNI